MVRVDIQSSKDSSKLCYAYLVPVIEIEDSPDVAHIYKDFKWDNTIGFVTFGETVTGLLSDLI